MDKIEVVVIKGLIKLREDVDALQDTSAIEEKFNEHNKLLQAIDARIKDINIQAVQDKISILHEQFQEKKVDRRVVIETIESHIDMYVKQNEATFSDMAKMILDKTNNTIERLIKPTAKKSSDAAIKAIEPEMEKIKKESLQFTKETTEKAVETTSRLVAEKTAKKSLEAFKPKFKTLEKQLIAEKNKTIEVRKSVKDGKQGRVGKQGEPGKDGTGIKDITFTNEELIIELTDKKIKKFKLSTKAPTIVRTPGGGVSLNVVEKLIEENKPNVPTLTSQLTNDSGFLTKEVTNWNDVVVDGMYVSNLGNGKHQYTKNDINYYRLVTITPSYTDVIYSDLACTNEITRRG